MEQAIYTILENRPLARQVYRMVLSGPTAAIQNPGQFVNIQLPGRFLRRPISVCDWDEKTLTLIYKVVGAGTGDMSRMAPGQTLDLLTGLGNGYDLAKSGPRPLLIGGGVGVPPLYGLCRRLIAAGKDCTVVLGFQNQADVFYVREFRALWAKVILMTDDGTAGQKGLVTQALPELEYTYLYACGPMPMLRAVNAVAVGEGQFSLEERMGCGFGACMGCTCQTRSGPKRICKDGPVLERGEILW